MNLRLYISTKDIYICPSSSLMGTNKTLESYQKSRKTNFEKELYIFWCVQIFMGGWLLAIHWIGWLRPCLLHCKENPIYVFLFWELHGLSPNFHIHVPVSDLYIPRIGPHISLQQNRQTDPGNI